MPETEPDNSVLSQHLLSESETEQLAVLVGPCSVLEAMQIAFDLIGERQDAPDPQTLFDLAAVGALTVNQARWVYIAQHVLSALGFGSPPAALPAPDRCRRCSGRGYVPDWANWNTEYGEPRPKPCPECTEQEPEDA